MAKRTNGAIYTKSWVVNLILDLAGYTSDQDLMSKCAVEPSCGEGAFAIHIVKRLTESAKLHHKDISQATNALKFIDSDYRASEKAKGEVRSLLELEGLDEQTVEKLLSSWFVLADYILMEELEQVDFVIGNPPYIRSNDLSGDVKESYLAICKTMTPGSDIYVGFIEKGLRSLSKTGSIAFICADRWMHNSYGKKLRQMVSSDYEMRSIVLMHDVSAFEEDVSAYPAIVVIEKEKSGRDCMLAFANSNLNETNWKELRESISLGSEHGAQGKGFEIGKISQKRLGEGSWPLIRPAQQEELEYLEENFPLLEESAIGTKVGIGMATGKDSVFVVHNEEIAERERMIPMCTSKQLSNGNVTEDPLWLVNPWNDNGELVELTDYPRLEAYFNSHYNELANRHIAKKNSYDWYRTIDKYHSGLEKQPKLLIQDMHMRFEPFYDDSHYPHGNLYYIIANEWDLEVLGGLLLSDVCESFIDAYGVKMRGGTLRFQAQFLRKIHVPYYKDLSDETCRGLKTAFRKRDRRLASEFARKAFQMEGY